MSSIVKWRSRDLVYRVARKVLISKLFSGCPVRDKVVDLLAFVVVSALINTFLTSNEEDVRSRRCHSYKVSGCSDSEQRLSEPRFGNGIGWHAITRKQLDCREDV